MAYYRMGMRFKLSRAATRAMARNGNRNNSAMNIERMLENAKHRFGGSVGRPLAAAVANMVDTSGVFHTPTFLFFDDGEDDDGTYVLAWISLSLASQQQQPRVLGKTDD